MNGHDFDSSGALSAANTNAALFLFSWSYQY